MECKTNVISGWELEMLKKGNLFINKYSLELTHRIIMDRYWKEFFFDILNELSLKEDIMLYIPNGKKVNLFSYFKKHYKEMINDNDLYIEMEDYIELVDNISFEEWEKDPSNGVLYTNENIYLVHISE